MSTIDAIKRRIFGRRGQPPAQETPPKRASSTRPRRSTVRSENLALPTQELQRVTAIKWWRYRHCFLEAKRIELELRTQQQ